MRHRHHLLTSVAALVLIASSSRADDRAAARPLFDEGRRLMKAGQIAEACAKFEAAAHLTSTSGVRLNLATCWAELGRTASAWATYDEARAIAERNGETEAAEVARKGKAELEPKLSRLVVSIADTSAAGLEVTRDGEPILSGAWGIGVPVDPGMHEIAARAPGRKPWSTRVNVVAEGKPVSVTVPLLEPEATAPAAAPVTRGPARANELSADREHSSSWRTVGWVAGGVGIVGLGVGAAFGFKAISDKNGAHCDSSGACDAGPLNDANTSATISTIGFVAGGVFLAGGVALVLFAPRRDTTASPAAGLKVTPLVGARDAGLLLGGTW